MEDNECLEKDSHATESKTGEQAVKIITVTALLLSYCTRLTEGWHVKFSQPLHRFYCVYSSVSCKDEESDFLKVLLSHFQPSGLKRC